MAAEALAPPSPGRLRAWVSALRPATLWAGVVPVLVGTSVAYSAGLFRPLPALAALLGSLLLQVGSNLVNDAADFLKGADGPDRLGPPRATQQGWLSLRAVVAGAALVYLLAALLGVYLLRQGGWPVALIGTAGILAGILYTAGPRPLAYLGLGEPTVFLFFGPAAVCGTVWVQGHAVPAAAWLAALPVGLLVTNILVVNNLRDAPTDARVHKRTFAVRYGPVATRRLYGLLLLLAFLAPALAATLLGRPGWLVALLAAPSAWAQWRGVAHKEGRALNAHLGGAARLVLLFGLLLSVGILL